MNVLKSASEYFASQASFETTGNAAPPHTVHARFITDDDNVFLRILLFIYTERHEDLDLDERNAIRYLGPALRLFLKPKLDLLARVLGQLKTFPGYIDHMLNELKTSDFAEEQMLKNGWRGMNVPLLVGGFGTYGGGSMPSGGPQVCNVCLKCAQHCDKKDLFVPISLPVLWLMTASHHQRSVDILALRKQIRAVLKKGLGTITDAAIADMHQTAMRNQAVRPTAHEGFLEAYHALFSAPFF
ncbi:hypothetical protein HKX48_000983 [Thoreauomyces humboldtii]|nr:hypothetical protein HKX48_000983 [Thoreauomyces humboldtii]